MRRRYLPPDRERLEPGRAASDEEHSQLAAAAGRAAGMPPFLSDLPAAVPSGKAAGDPTAVPTAPQPAMVPDVSGEGFDVQVSAYSVTLRGRTDADFSSSFRTRNVRTGAGSGCENCAGADCVHVTGILESTFRVRTTVTLPSVDDFPGLTACQRQRVQDGITNVLAPHEQEHVVAFNTYAGTVRTPFDLTLCRSDFDARIQELHDSVEAGRRTAAQAASDALDPFSFDVDLDCTD